MTIPEHSDCLDDPQGVWSSEEVTLGRGLLLYFKASATRFFMLKSRALRFSPPGVADPFDFFGSDSDVSKSDPTMLCLESMKVNIILYHDKI